MTTTVLRPCLTTACQSMIISRTPVRISFFGGGTDYPDFYKREWGAVLGTTINQYVYITVHSVGPFREKPFFAAYSKTELVHTVDEIEHPSIRECLKYMNAVHKHLDVHIFSDLPARTGLGSSSSFTVGLLNALYALDGKEITKEKLAELACHIEQKRIQENVGSQDQHHAAHGGFNIFQFASDDVRVKPLAITEAKLQVLEDHLMLFYTGLTRHASEVLKEQIEKTKGTSNDDILLRLREMVFEAEEMVVSEREEKLAAHFGRLLDEGWQLKKQLSSKISNDLIDQTYTAAKAAGALGGKLCGAGSGGFLALLVPLEKKEAVRSALKGMFEVKCRFENEGSSIIHMKA
jgi:D-glycero-alpha-D-manno-heptose-7-phosphate kinase